MRSASAVISASDPRRESFFHALQVVPSPDDKFAFVALQNSGNVAVFNLHKALTSGFGPADFVGMIPMRSDRPAWPRRRMAATCTW